ncbi:MAG: sterol desaturase family protein [Rhizobiaceae bacterium]|nr:sterol desaturase family protein [Rhizobiaceae bacterium]
MQAPSFVVAAVPLVCFVVALRLVEMRRGKERRLPLMRRGFATDLAYWVFTPVVSRGVMIVCVAAVTLPLARHVFGAVDFTAAAKGFGPASQLPILLQTLLALVIADFAGYWMHRAFHGRALWRFHAIHHSSVDLDWLSSVRQHPVNDALMRVVEIAPALALGFDPLAVVYGIPFLAAMAILVHANVDWDWGPLRAVIASPRFHRWHHADEREARDRNFAAVLPLWDIAFGTYYMPAGREASRFGIDTPVPESFLQQVFFPFRSELKGEKAASAPPLPAE